MFDALLAAIGEGRLTDAAGRVADFRNAIVIMTSNLGATSDPLGPLGFGARRCEQRRRRARYVEEAEQFFRPEFFNRIDRVVVFHPLGEADGAADRPARARAAARARGDRRAGSSSSRLDDAVVDAVAASGFHPRYGARPLQRADRASRHRAARATSWSSARPQDGDFVRVHLADGAHRGRVRAGRRARGAQLREASVAQPQDDASFAKSERMAARSPNGSRRRSSGRSLTTFAPPCPSSSRRLTTAPSGTTPHVRATRSSASTASSTCSDASMRSASAPPA